MSIIRKPLTPREKSSDSQEEILRKILTNLNRCLEVPSVISREKPFLSHLAEVFGDNGFKIGGDDHLLVASRNGSDWILTAHVDRHGIIVNDEKEFEFAAYYVKKRRRRNDRDRWFKKWGKRVVGEKVFYKDQEQNVTKKGFVRRRKNKTEERLLFEIEGLDGLKPGAAIAFESPVNVMGNKVSCQLDNAVSVAVIEQLATDGFKGTILFSTKEEIGKSWQHIIRYLREKEIESKHLLTLDTTPYYDESVINQGPVVFRYKDSSGNFNKCFVDKLRGKCEANDIPVDMKEKGMTELGRIVEETNGDLNGATVQLPTTKHHTNHETTSKIAIYNYYKALKIMLIN